MPAYEDIALFLETLLDMERYPDEENTRYRPSSRPVARLGLALEPTPALPRWVRDNALDAVFLHRPWRLDLTRTPAEVGILMSHLPFDDAMTIGNNPCLASLLGMGETVPFAERDGRTLGMVGKCAPCSFGTVCETMASAFAGLEGTWAGAIDSVTCLACAGAMTDALVRDAASLGAQVYMTGQFRVPAREAVRETGMAVVAVGHRRSEVWGLTGLAALLRERWPELAVTVAE